MAGQLDTALKKIAKQVVSQLGNSLDSSIIYTRKGISSYDADSGEFHTVDTTYNIKVPIEFVQSSEESGFQENIARTSQLKLNQTIERNGSEFVSGIYHSVGWISSVKYQI